ncbi:apoptotic protease-activating factor 1 isoform X1, partial [Silurus meridionalis]
IWNLEKGTLVRVFNVEHDEQINHCQFTNMKRRILLATCSNDKITNTK